MKNQKTIIVSFAIFITGFLLFMQNVIAQSLNESELILNENIEALEESEGSTVVCGDREKKGPCWKKGNELKFCGEHTYIECVATKSTSDNCTHPC